MTLRGRLVVADMRAVHECGMARSLAWVVRPDHVHWLFQLEARATLADTMKRFTGRTARVINERPQRNGPLWQKAYYGPALRKGEDLRRIARYIVANPIRAGLVRQIGDYSLWDPIWL